jgi:hypothetical protein
MNGDEGQIRPKRDAAARARRLAAGVYNEEIRRRMLAFAATLDGEADALERSLTTPPPPQVTRMQMQVQQQQQGGEANEAVDGRTTKDGSILWETTPTTAEN